MKLIIAGSCPPKDQDPTLAEKFGKALWTTLLRNMKHLPMEIEEVVSGKAAGGDRAGEVYADLMNIPVKSFPADWTKHGKKAGPLRNIDMAEYADAAVVLWDGKSTGSWHMVQEMTKRQKPCYIFYIGEIK